MNEAKKDNLWTTSSASDSLCVFLSEPIFPEKITLPAYLDKK